MPNQQSIFYPAVIEPILPDSLRPEVIPVDKYWQPERRPVELKLSRTLPYYYPAWFSDVDWLPETLRPEVILPDKWWAQDVIPGQLRVAPFFNRGYLSDLTTFSDLFAVAPTAPPVGTLLLLKVGR